MNVIHQELTPEEAASRGLERAGWVKSPDPSHAHAPWHHTKTVVRLSDRHDLLIHKTRCGHGLTAELPVEDEPTDDEPRCAGCIDEAPVVDASAAGTVDAPPIDGEPADAMSESGETTATSPTSDDGPVETQATAPGQVNEVASAEEPPAEAPTPNASEQGDEHHGS